MQADQDNNDTNGVSQQSNDNNAVEDTHVGDTHVSDTPVSEQDESGPSGQGNRQHNEVSDERFIYVTFYRARVLRQMYRRDKYVVPETFAPGREYVEKMLDRLVALLDLVQKPIPRILPVTKENMEIALELNKIWREWKSIVLPPGWR